MATAIFATLKLTSQVAFCGSTTAGKAEMGTGECDPIAKDAVRDSTR